MHIGPETLKLGANSQEVRFDRQWLDMVTHVNNVKAEGVSSGLNGKKASFTKGSVGEKCRCIGLGCAPFEGTAKNPSVAFPEELHQPGVLHGLPV